MKDYKAIKGSNLPPRLPLTLTAVIYLLLDKFSLPEWILGAAGLFMLIWWTLAIYAIYKYEPVDIIEKLKKL